MILRFIKFVFAAVVGFVRPLVSQSKKCITLNNIKIDTTKMINTR